MNALIPLDQIHDNPYQERTDYGDIESLAITIANEDLQQCPKARKNGKGYQLKFGHRRTEAFRWLYHNWEAKGLPSRYDGYSKMPLDIQDVSDEEMFRGAAVENVRKDLNDIERAKIIREYREKFGKTSDEAGALLGMNGATARGIERLLNLHPDAQKLLAEGKITQGTARTLLSVQKIVDGKAVAATVKKLADEPNTNAHDSIIESAIERGNNVIEMWGRWDGDGKPRAGRDLWLLDMKNFPNKALAVLSVDDLAKTLGLDEKRDAVALGEIIAIASDANADPQTETGKRALHLVNPPACNACPFYAVVNKTHYCGVKLCHDRKEAAYAAQKLADMSRSLKIAIYQKSDGACLLLDEDQASHKKAFEARHADLRLLPKASLSGYSYQRFSGVDSSTAVIVAVGNSANTLAVKGHVNKVTGGKKTEKEKAEMRAMRQYRVYRKELMWEYTAAAQVVFESLSLETIKKIRNWHFVGIDDRIPDEYERNTDGDKQAFQRRALVWALIVGETSHYTRHELAPLLNKFTALTGVKAPKSLTAKAQAWDAEIAALAKPVAMETKKGK